MRIADMRRAIYVLPWLFLGTTFFLVGCAVTNKPPVAIADASPLEGEAPLTVLFDGSQSFDPDGRIVSFSWEFGDGSPAASGQTASHKFQSEGTFKVVLTVTDDRGNQDSDKLFINVGRSSIYYASDQAGDLEIFRMDSDGTNHARITFSMGPDMFPALLPKGRTHLAFSSLRDKMASCPGGPTCALDLFISQPDGTLPINLTAAQTASHEVQPSWSPDGKKIVFASDMDYIGQQYGLYIYDLEADLILTLEVQSGSHALSPSWSPEGDWIAFTSDRDGDFEIYKIKPDSTSLTQLTNNNVQDGFHPSLLTNFGGLLATNAPIVRGLSWSPDGKKIAFASDANGNFDIFIINADGTGLTQVTTHTANDLDPFWLPNGTEIAFVSDRDGNLKIYKLNVNTLLVTGPLTPLGTFNINPAGLKQ